MPQGPEEWYKGCEKGLPLLKKYYEDQTFQTIFNEDYCLIGISHLSEWAFQSSQPSFRVASIPESSHIFCLQYYFISQS